MAESKFTKMFFNGEEINGLNPVIKAKSVNYESNDREGKVFKGFAEIDYVNKEGLEELVGPVKSLEEQLIEGMAKKHDEGIMKEIKKAIGYRPSAAEIMVYAKIKVSDDDVHTLFWKHKPILRWWTEWDLSDHEKVNMDVYFEHIN